MVLLSFQDLNISLFTTVKQRLTLYKQDLYVVLFVRRPRLDPFIFSQRCKSVNNGGPFDVIQNKYVHVENIVLGESEQVYLFDFLFPVHLC